MKELFRGPRFFQAGGHLWGPALQELVQASPHGAVVEAAVLFKLKDITKGEEPSGAGFRLGDHGESSISWGNVPPGLALDGHLS